MMRIAVVVLAASLASCTVTVPVAVVTSGVKGGIMRGSATASVSGGSFNVAAGALSCAGSYNAMDTSPTISIPVICNDGRKGVVIATRDNSGMGGGGTFTLNDGSTGNFIFGEAAKKL